MRIPYLTKPDLPTLESNMAPHDPCRPRQHPQPPNDWVVSPPAPAMPTVPSSRTHQRDERKSTTSTPLPRVDRPSLTTSSPRASLAMKRLTTYRETFSGH